MNIPDSAPQMHFRRVSRRFKGRCRRAVGPVEVTALLNVILLLFMFAWNAQRFVLQPAIRIALPAAPFTEAVPYGAFVLLVPPGEALYFNDERLPSLDALPAALRAARANAPEGRADILLLEADESTPNDRLTAICTAATDAGFREIALATRPPPADAD